MSFEVIIDDVKKVAALVDAEFGRALGPIATGEHAVELLEKFAAAHGVDPATIPTPELEARWKDFVTTLAAPVEAEGEKIIAAGEKVLGIGGHANAGDTDPLAAAGTGGSAASGTPAAPTPAPPAADAASTADADPLGEAAEPGPVNTPQEGYEICPTCDGWREVPGGSGVVTCPTCDGKGEIPVKLDTEASHSE